MKELKSTGPWPENSIADINNARAEISNMMKFSRTPTVNVYVSTLLRKAFDYMLTTTDTTYYRFFRDNNLANIYEWKHVENNVAVIRSEDHEIIINGIELNKPQPCAFCPNLINLHQEALKLKDGRLICKECYAKVFETILQSLQGSVKDD